MICLPAEITKKPAVKLKEGDRTPTRQPTALSALAASNSYQIRIIITPSS